MIDLFRTLSGVAILAFATSSMLAAGLSFTLRAIVAPLREPGRVARALIGNFVLVPILAVFLARAFALAPTQALGLILLGTAAGAPFLIRLIAAAEGDVATGTSLLVLLVPMTVVAMPILVPLLAPDAVADPRRIAAPLALTMLAPLAGGLLVRQLAPRFAARLAPIARVLSSIALVLLLVATTVVHARELRDVLASRASLAIILFVLGAFAIGALIASPHPERRVVLGLGTAQRNIAAATVVAAQNIRFDDLLAPPDAGALVLVIVTSVLDLAVLFAVARWLRARRRGARDERSGHDPQLHLHPGR